MKLLDDYAVLQDLLQKMDQDALISLAIVHCKPSAIYAAYAQQLKDEGT